jgi:hypothetical protein
MSTPIISAKPTGNYSYVPERKSFDKDKVFYYLDGRRYSGKRSEDRKTHLRNSRNLKKFTLSLLPVIEEEYNKRIA